jgi:hypothetical protein
MSVRFRHYNDPQDYQLVDDFLIEHYLPGNICTDTLIWINPR